MQGRKGPHCTRALLTAPQNCILKPPPTPNLRLRHRRLCRTCTSAPLAHHLHDTDADYTGSDEPHAHAHDYDHDHAHARAFTAPAFERTPCACDTAVWLCAPCGKDLRAADTMYVRGWSWRTRYTHYLGGVGTGAGEGNEGVECGRGTTCLGARIVEHETCRPSSPDALDHGTMQDPESPERWRGSSYLAQEIEGIGGVLKVKHKRQVRVGECVRLYEDERDKSIQYLEPEVEGRLRSWCSWCERVVLGEADKGVAMTI